MKKLIFAAMLLCATGTALAGDSEALKAIKKAKSFKECLELIEQSKASLQGAKESATAYKKLVDLSTAYYQEQNATMATNEIAAKSNGEVKAVDTLGMYDAAYYAVVGGLECYKYDNMPDEKGKVKPKYLDDLKQVVTNTRIGLVNAGQWAAQKNDTKAALKYWGTFLDSDDSPFSQKEQEKAFIGQVAYFTAYYAYQAGEIERANKYCEIAMADAELANDATNLKFQIMQQNLKTREDSLKYINELKGFYATHPESEAAFGTLANLYSTMNMAEEFKSLLDDKIAKDPNNATAWALKGQAEMNKQDYEHAIASFKKSLEINPENPIILTYLGFSINQSAGQLDNRQKQKELYQESMGYLEKARTLDPNREKSNWAYPLWQCYYIIYSGNDAKTKEMQKLANMQ